jgi:hypothetical protein
MDTTFTQRSNAKRAAERMIATGTAPAVDYGIKPRDDGGFEIVWKTAPNADTASEGISGIAASQVVAAAAQADPGANAGESSRAANDPAESDSAATAPPPRPATAAASAAAGAEQDPELAGFETPRLIGELQRRGYRTAQARQSRAQRPARGQRMSKAAELDEAAARGVMPTKPDVTSHANHHYQKRFDKLAELAAADDWDAVAGYECNGINSYAKMVRQYRDRLLAAHAASEAAQ